MNIGIVGGMGPEATSMLFSHIIKFTNAKKDQDHIRVFIDNNSSIPDRTEYILGSGEDPLPYLIDSAKKLEEIGSNVLIMPCNTAHYFFNGMKEAVNIDMIDMIEETAKYISENYKYKKVGLLATFGTYKIGLYKEKLEKYGMEIVQPSDEGKKIVMDYIYEVKSGNDKNDYNLKKIANYLINEGAGVVIMGCTELSVALDKYKMEGLYIDPLKILAKTAIKFVGKKIRE